MTPDALLQEMVSAQADRWPESPAIAWRHNAWRYREVEERSNQLARTLREAGCRRGDRVCLLLPRGPEAIVAMLAALKADGVAVPLDISGTPSRLSRIIRLCEPRCVLTVSPGAAQLDEILRTGVPGDPLVVGSLGASPIVGEHFATEFCATDVARLPGRALAYRNRTASPAAIIFNQSSRDTSRGVALTHANIRRFLLWANEYFGVLPGDRHSWQAPLSEGISLYDTLGTLTAGACVFPAPDDLGLHAGRLTEFVREARLTMWTVPPHARLETSALELIQPGDFQSVRNVIWQGDSLPMPVLREWMRRFRHVHFTRVYGATEGSIVSCYHRMSNVPDAEGTAIPLGRPRMGEGLLVLDPSLHPTPQDEVGEVHLRGLGLSPGYWRDPSATTERFPMITGERVFRTGDLARVASDGNVYAAGTRERRRTQRVQFGEVEAALRRLGSVRAAAVVALRASESDSLVLGCAYVPVPGIDVTAAALLADLAAMLPADLVPTRWQAFDELPRDSDGTIDADEIRRSLSSLPGARVTPVS